MYYAFAGMSANYNTILRSVDNGQNWDTLVFDVGIYGTLYCKHQDTLFVGSGEGIYRSVNTGLDWLEMNCFPDTFSMNFRDITFTDPLNGYAVGGGSIIPEIRPSNIYKTTDGGENWYRQYYAHHGGLYSVCFISDSIGIACGEDLMILKTTNSGGIGVGSKEIFNNENSCLIYPNPTSNYLNIRYPKSDIRYSILIYDMFGKLMDEIVISSGQEESRIDVSAYQNGIYMAAFKNDSGMLVRKKFVVAR